MDVAKWRLWRAAPRDDVVGEPLDGVARDAVREAAAFEICAEAGEKAREGSLSLEGRAEYERQIRCALATDARLTKTYLGYLDLAVLAGEILLCHAGRKSTTL